MMDSEKFLIDIQDFINKSVKHDSLKKQRFTCHNSFKNTDNYQDEQAILAKIKVGIMMD